jgi:hypothetical protein
VQIEYHDFGSKRFLAAALDYAALGFAVFPCKHGSKEPATRRGFYEASTNPATIRRWFGGSHEYNIAVCTGLASGCWVLDVDDISSLQSLEDQYGPLPTTRKSQGSRGLHLWWRATAPIPGSVGRVADGIDVQGELKYVVVPPSIHPSGVAYRWLSTESLAVAPDWLVSLTRKPAPAPIILPARTHNRPPAAYGAAALEREIETWPLLLLEVVTTRSTGHRSPCTSWWRAANSTRERSSAGYSRRLKPTA